MSFSSLLDGFDSIKVLLVGDLMLDEYIFGRATRISPEAPVMIIRRQSIARVPGGAANVARNLKALGGQCHIVGVVGCDAAGQTLEEALRQDGSVGLVCDPTRITTSKTRVLADHAHQVLRIDHEEEDGIAADVEQELLREALAGLAGANVVVLSDYLKGALTENVAAKIIETAKDRGMPVVVNPKPRSLGQYRGASLVSLNRSEAADALGIWQGISDSGSMAAARQIREASGAEAVLITLGESGMAIAGPQDFEIEAPRVEVYDTAGAGDTVIAAVALGLASVGFEKAVFELAARAAAAVVKKVGVATPSKEDLAEIRALG